MARRRVPEEALAAATPYHLKRQYLTGPNSSWRARAAGLWHRGPDRVDRPARSVLLLRFGGGAVCDLLFGLTGSPRVVRQEIRPPRLLPRRVEGFFPIPDDLRRLLGGAIFQKLAHLRLPLQRPAQQGARSHRIVDLTQPVLQLLQRVEALFQPGRIARSKKLQRIAQPLGCQPHAV